MSESMASEERLTWTVEVRGGWQVTIQHSSSQTVLKRDIVIVENHVKVDDDTLLKKKKKTPRVKKKKPKKTPLNKVSKDK